jgi:MoaA/NifB/PqqE/SkfB family radical SAM enzyme
MSDAPDYVDLFNRNIRAFFGDALWQSVRDPRLALFFYRTLRQQKRAARTRQAWEQQGVHVPPFMIASITKRCNLKCKGCYARAQQRSPEAEMSADKLRSVIAEARDLGVSIILLAGGEPLTRPEILDITADFPEVIFPLFTNGLLIDDQIIAKLKTQRHVVPVISLEGHQVDTDARRGAGVYTHVAAAMRQMREAGIFLGTSLTVTRRNLEIATGEPFVRDLLDMGCRLFFFVDYVPVQPGTEELELTEAQRASEARALVSLRKKLPGLFVAFPGDEELYGGCLAAGRGFVHISPEGRLEPCPFSPFSDASLQDLSLKEALQSKFLRAIRESDAQLSEAKGGCALWEKRAWVSALLRSGQSSAP